MSLFEKQGETTHVDTTTRPNSVYCNLANRKEEQEKGNEGDE
jgi:hypothetical protein